MQATPCSRSTLTGPPHAGGMHLSRRGHHGASREASSGVDGADEEGIDVIGDVLFGVLAADLMQFSGPRGVHAEARGDARPACPRERLQAHRGCRAAATAQPLNARPDKRRLGRTWESMLAGDRASQPGAAAAHWTIVDCPIGDPYL